MVSKDHLNKLSTELLVKIFSYLSVKDLCNLSQSCKRFKEIISFWDNVFFKTAPTPIVTNQISDTFFSKCSRRLRNFDKLRISRNWRTGRYFENSLLSSRKKYCPHLQLSSRYLWMSRGTDISCYERIYCSLSVGRPIYVLRGESKADVVNFKIKDDLMLSGLRDGTIWLKNINDQSTVFELPHFHNSDVNSVDLSRDGNIIVSGTRDGEVKICKVNDGHVNKSVCTLSNPDLVWKVSLSEKNMLAVGTAGNVHTESSLHVYDIERIGDPIKLLHMSGSIGGTLDILWDGSHTLWTCGYDSYLKRWDLRTKRIEQCMMDPFGYVLYCLDYDYQNTIITGAQLNGRTILWDVRKDTAIQMYFMESCKKGYNRSSPVYSLAFDSEFLFTATDQNLNVLDFSGYEAPSNDYAFFLK